MRRRTRGWVAVELVVILACTALAGAADVRAADGGTVVGETLAIAADNVPLMLGNTVLATLPRGDRVVVAGACGQWIGTYVQVNGRSVGGWLWGAALARTGATLAASGDISTGPVTGSSPVPYSSAMPISPEPAPARQMAVVVRPMPVMNGGAWSTSDDPFLIGRFERHEVDPNIHAWEPWRHR